MTVTFMQFYAHATQPLLTEVASVLQTDRLIAMGIPSEGMEGQFRNPMSEVIRFFDTKHPNAAKVRRPSPTFFVRDS